MKKLTTVIAAALCVCLTACSAAEGFSGNEILSDSVKRNRDSSVTYNYADGCREAPTAYNSFANTVTGFSLKLLRNAYDGQAISLAPASSAIQLGLLANGTNGDSRSEILLALGGELDLDSYNTCCSYFKSRMESVGKTASSGNKDKTESQQRLKLGGALFINDKTDVRSAFLQTNANFYSDDVIRYDFSSGADKLKAYLGDSFTLSADNCIASCSELSFADLWLNQSLSSEEFSMSSGNAKGIVKYTLNNPLKALFIMPDGDFDAYVKSFDSAEYSRLLDSIDVTERQAAVIPAFRTEAQTNDLSDVLGKIGLYTLFTKDSDFRGMAYSEGLTLDRFCDITPEVSVSNQGVATAKATDDAAASAKTDGAWIFDKPFIFMLVDNETDIPIYISTIEQ